MNDFKLKVNLIYFFHIIMKIVNFLKWILLWGMKAKLYIKVKWHKLYVCGVFDKRDFHHSPSDDFFVIKSYFFFYIKDVIRYLKMSWWKNLLNVSDFRLQFFLGFGVFLHSRIWFYRLDDKPKQKKKSFRKLLISFQQDWERILQVT